MVVLAPGDSIWETYRFWINHDHPGDPIPPGAYWVVGGFMRLRPRYPWAVASLHVVDAVHADRDNTAPQPSSEE